MQCPHLYAWEDCPTCCAVVPPRARPPVRGYGVRGNDGRWLMGLRVRSTYVKARRFVDWTPHVRCALALDLDEAKALAALVPKADNHPLFVEGV